MQPQIVLARDIRDFRQRINGTGINSSGGGDHGHWSLARSFVGLNGLFKLRWNQAEIPASRDQAQVFPAETQQRHALGNRHVHFF